MRLIATLLLLAAVSCSSAHQSTRLELRAPATSGPLEASVRADGRLIPMTLLAPANARVGDFTLLADGDDLRLSGRIDLRWPIAASATKLRLDLLNEAGEVLESVEARAKVRPATAVQRHRRELEIDLALPSSPACTAMTLHIGDN